MIFPRSLHSSFHCFKLENHFPLAVRKSFKRDEKGNYPVNYFQIEVWGALAKTCKEHLSKGQLVSVSGRLDAKSYDDKNGQKRYTTMVVASAVDFLTPKQATMVMQMHSILWQRIQRS